MQQSFLYRPPTWHPRPRRRLPLFTASSLAGFDLSGAAYEFRNNTGTLIASTAITFWVHDVTTGALVVKITGYSTNGSGIVGTVSDAALTAATQYRVAYEFSTGEYGVAKLTTA